MCADSRKIQLMAYLAHCDTEMMHGPWQVHFAPADTINQLSLVDLSKFWTLFVPNYNVCAESSK